MAQEQDGSAGLGNNDLGNGSVGNSDGGSSDEWKTLGGSDAESDGGGIDPRTASLGTNSGESGTGKRRGRKPGSTNKKQKTSADIGLLAGGVVFLHHCLAGALKVQEIEIGDDEAEKLTKASLEVMSHYQVVPSEKAMAWLALASVIGGIYGTRIMAYKIRVKVEAEEKKQSPTNVTPFTGFSGNGFPPAS